MALTQESPRSWGKSKFPGSRVFQDRAYLLRLEGQRASLLSLLPACLTLTEIVGLAFVLTLRQRCPALQRGHALSSWVLYLPLHPSPGSGSRNHTGTGFSLYTTGFRPSCHLPVLFVAGTCPPLKKGCPLLCLTLLYLHIHLACQRKDILKILSVSLAWLGPPTRTWPSPEQLSHCNHLPCDL